MLWDMRSSDLSANDQFRVVRILRCFRALHMVRMLKPFRRLRVILYSVVAVSIMACLSSLVWALVLMCIMVFLAAIYFEDVALLHIQLHNMGRHTVITVGEFDEFRTLIATNWGCMFDAWLSLLYSVTGGADWASLALPFYMINPVHCLLYLMWVILITLGLVNITVGVFARQASLERRELRQHGRGIEPPFFSGARSSASPICAVRLLALGSELIVFPPERDFYQWDPHLIVEGAHSDHESTRTVPSRGTVEE
ncbi:unnamed protein product [Prorocentrum cordatum]|uniref:Ion transport domain-containing protein n=1 Tax=Prorocentrum cordatum TaxID=2364126 RepID=A0ABN9TNE6_9DINO|nr:unnamed protein product [Polarella glacialis]